MERLVKAGREEGGRISCERRGSNAGKLQEKGYPVTEGPHEEGEASQYFQFQFKFSAQVSVTGLLFSYNNKFSSPFIGRYELRFIIAQGGREMFPEALPKKIPICQLHSPVSILTQLLGINSQNQPGCQSNQAFWIL
jgi:hypothetical protein